MEDRTSFWNPVLAKVISYVPATIEDVSYKPSWFVVKVLVTPVLVFTTVTVTSGSTAPLTSVTVPRISPEFVLCAKPTSTRPVHAMIASITANQFNFVLPLNLILPPKILQLTLPLFGLQSLSCKPTILSETNVCPR